jgi:hypothetical protein
MTSRGLHGSRLISEEVDAMNHTYNPSTPYATLMRGRPDEPDSHQHIAVYSKHEYETFIRKGWVKSMEFMARVERAMRRDV